MNNNAKTLDESVMRNPWYHTYWFARMLINGDKYGAIGKETRFLTEVCVAIRKIIEDASCEDSLKVNLVKDVIKGLFEKRFFHRTGRTDRINLFLEDLFLKFETLQDISVFVFTAESILVPINIALATIPNDDKDYAEVIAKAYLDKLGHSALATVINLWDDAGVEGCLNAERIAVIQGFKRLRQDIYYMPEDEANMVLTAYVQEFERRLGQKRKGRAGGSLEDVTRFLFEYFDIKAESKPEHFQADIEIDKWVRCKDKWLVGISCKRTLRERWKQVSSASPEILSKFKIKEIWHVITYDEDLSDEKLTLLGGLRHVFYLRDESRRLESARHHVGKKDYVRPMSSFIHDLRKEQGIV